MDFLTLNIKKPALRVGISLGADVYEFHLQLWKFFFLHLLSLLDVYMSSCLPQLSAILADSIQSACVLGAAVHRLLWGA